MRDLYLLPVARKVCKVSRRESLQNTYLELRQQVLGRCQLTLKPYEPLHDLYINLTDPPDFGVFAQRVKVLKPALVVFRRAKSGRSRGGAEHMMPVPAVLQVWGARSSGPLAFQRRKHIQACHHVFGNRSIYGRGGLAIPIRLGSAYNRSCHTRH